METNSSSTSSSPIPVANSPQMQPQYQYPPQQAASSKKGIILVVILLFLIVGVVGTIFAVLLPRLGSGGVGGNVELTYWGLWQDETVIEPLIADYEAEHPNINIEYVRQSPEEYRERLTSAMARGEAPDIFRMHNTWTPMFYEELSTLPSDIMSEEEYSNTFYPAAIASLSTPNGIGAIPLMYDSMSLFINQDIFTTFSEPVPESWSEFRQTATNLTVREQDEEVIRQAGASLGRTDNVDYWPEIVTLMQIQNGADLIEPKGELSIGSFQYYLQYSLVDKVWDETLPASTLAFATGKLGMFIAPSFTSQEIVKLNPNLRFRAHPVPQLPKFDPSDPDITYAIFWAEAVWSGGKHQKEAWEFLKFLSSQESMQKLYAKTKEPYSRRDMAALLASDPYYSATVRLAEDSRVFYTASNTHDGETGINSQIKAAYEKVLGVDNLRIGGDLSNTVTALGLEMRTILSKYGLAEPPPPPEE